MCGAAGQPRGEALPWLAELLGVSSKAHWEVGEGSEPRAWHTLLSGQRAAAAARGHPRTAHQAPPKSAAGAEGWEGQDGKGTFPG